MTSVNFQTSSRFVHDHVIEKYPILNLDKVEVKNGRKRKNIYSILGIEESRLVEILPEIHDSIKRESYFIISRETDKVVRAFHLGKTYNSQDELRDLKVLGITKFQS